MSKELKINVPVGYEIDESKSTFTNIVFKEVDTFESESFWFQGFEYKTVKSPNTGRIWLDRHLGASHPNAYGGYFKFNEATCPDGYEVPSDEEWRKELPNNLKAEIDWLNIPFAGAIDPEGDATRHGVAANMWSSTEYTGQANYARVRNLLATSLTVYHDGCLKAAGFSVRLIKKDNIT